MQTDDQRTFSLLSFLYPIYFLISYFRLFLSLSFFLFFFPFLFFLVLSFPLPFFFSGVGVPVPCVPGVPASSRTFLLYFYLFTRMYSYVTLCTGTYSYVIGVYPYVLVCYSYVLVWCFSQDRQRKLISNYSSSPNGLWVNSPWGRSVLQELHLIVRGYTWPAAASLSIWHLQLIRQHRQPWLNAGYW